MEDFIEYFKTYSKFLKDILLCIPQEVIIIMACGFGTILTMIIVRYIFEKGVS